MDMDINRIINLEQPHTPTTTTTTPSAPHAGNAPSGRSAFQSLVPLRPTIPASTSNPPRSAALPAQTVLDVSQVRHQQHPETQQLLPAPLALRAFAGPTLQAQPTASTGATSVPAMPASAASAGASNAPTPAGPSAPPHTFVSYNPVVSHPTRPRRTNQKHFLTQAHQGFLDGLTTERHERSIVALFLDVLQRGLPTASGSTSRTIHTLPEFQALDRAQQKAVVDTLINGGLNASLRSVLKKFRIADLDVPSRGGSRAAGLVRAPHLSGDNRQAVDTAQALTGETNSSKRSYKQFVGYLQRETPTAPDGTRIATITAFRALSENDRDTMLDNAVQQKKVTSRLGKQHVNDLEARMNSNG